MNITRYNYKKSLPLIVQTLNTSDFISFDFEFSGLQLHPDLANHQTDSIAFRYWKLRENVRKFLPTQMGICGFKYDEPSKTLHCYPFNFYVLPYTLENLSMDKNFTVSISAFNFLAQNKFDFNKLFYESVGYLSYQEYQQFQKMRTMKSQQSETLDASFLDSPECMIFCNSKFPTIKNWLETVGRTITDIENDERNQLKIDVGFTRAKLFQSLIKNLPKMFPHDLLDCELVIEENSTEMYLMIKKTTQEVKAKEKLKKEREEKYLELQRFLFAKNLGAESAADALKLLIDEKEWDTKNEKFKKLAEEIEILFREPLRIQQAFENNTEDELLSFLASKVIDVQPSKSQDALGFTRIVDLMARLQKPIISHNGLMDLMFLYDKFYRPLPETQFEFKTAINALFPHIYDNKHMINTRQSLQQVFPNSMLSETYLRVQKDDFKFDQQLIIHESFGDYSFSGTVYHEAGFDALMTGVVWFKMMTYLGRERKFPQVENILANDQFNSMDKNKIPMASIKTSMNLETKKEQGLPTDIKSFVFVLKDVPFSKLSDDIQSLLSKRFDTDIKVYRAYNKEYLFFTVFGKDIEDKIHEQLKNSNDQLIFETEDGDKKVQYKIVSYSKYENDLKEMIVEEDKIKDTLPEYIYLLNK